MKTERHQGLTSDAEESRELESKSTSMHLNLGLAIAVMLIMLAYSRVHTFQFVNWDDNVYVSSRHEIRDGLTVAGMHWSMSSFLNGNWHPITWFSYMLDIELFGMDPGMMHVTNLVLHCLNAFLVGHLVRSLTGEHWLALSIAGFFGLHPQHVEVVAWVSERKELLCTLFGLLSMMRWIQYRATGFWRHSIEAHGLYLLSLLSKQMLVTLPFLFVVLAICPRRNTDKMIRWKEIPRECLSVSLMFVMAFGFTICAIISQKSSGAIVSSEFLPWGERLANAAQSLVMYLGQSIVPIQLSPFYVHPLLEVSTRWTVVCGAMLMAASIFVWKYRTRPMLLAGWLWFLGTLVPVLGIIQLGEAARADRYTYFPHIGLFLVLGSLPVPIALMFQSRVLGRTIVTTNILVFAWLSSCQAEIWHDSVSLWQACLKVDPENYRGHDQLAIALLADDRVTEAKHQAQIAITYPKNRQLGYCYMTLGTAQLFQGDLAGAEVNLREAIRVSPGNTTALVNLGFVVRYTDPAEAKLLFESARRYDPGNIDAIANLANCEAQDGNLQRASELLCEALMFEPNNVQLKANLRVFQDAQIRRQ